jgi:glycosyltransferase involved in cell wall biosynthesis
LHYLCFANSYDINNSTGSGRMNDMINSILDKGHQITLITSSYDYLTGKTVPNFKGLLCSIEKHESLRIIRGRCYSGYNKSKMSRILTFTSFLFSSIYSLRYVKKCDKIFVGTPPFFLGFPGLIAKYFNRAELIYEVRDLWVDVAIELGYLKSKFLIKIVKKTENIFLNKSSKIITNSPAFKSYIINYGVNEEKIFFIPNGVDLKMFFPIPKNKNLLKDLELKNKFIVIYTGAHGEANNLEYVLESAKIIASKTNIVIIFIGDGNRKNYLKNQAIELKLNNVLFIDPVPKNELINYLSIADVGLATLKPTNFLKTTYPNKVFDYMACKLPCIIGIDGVIRDLVESNKAGVFADPKNPESLAKEIIFMSTLDKESIGKMGESGYNVIRKSFNRNVSTQQLAKHLGCFNYE